VTILKLPQFAENELSRISSDLSPVNMDIRELLAYQEKYNTKAVSLEGTVKSVISIDETDEATVATWFFEIIPTTVTTTASATYFYVENDFKDRILVKYPADLDVSSGDTVSILGYFKGHGITIETKGLIRTKKEQLLNVLGEPFITAVVVTNKTREKVEYIRKTP
jgi:hypothetical protein